MVEVPASRSAAKYFMRMAFSPPEAVVAPDQRRCHGVPSNDNFAYCKKRKLTNFDGQALATLETSQPHLRSALLRLWENGSESCPACVLPGARSRDRS